MHFTKWVSIVGFCAGSLLSTYANAEQWILNCESNLCLDATGYDIVKVAKCDKSLSYQGWNANTPKEKKIENNGNKKCLDFNTDGYLTATNGCNDDLKAQNWIFDLAKSGTIKNEYVGKCIQGGDNNAHVKMVDCTDDDKSQQWKGVSVGTTKCEE